MSYVVHNSILRFGLKINHPLKSYRSSVPMAGLICFTDIQRSTDGTILSIGSMNQDNFGT